MSKAGKLVKNLVKAKKESVMGKLGDSPYEDPMEPWSAKYQQPVKEEILNEDSLLMKYIKSLGFNPEFMSFAQRSSYARSNAFKRYKQSHTFDTVKQNLNQGDVSEEVKQIDEAGTGLLMSFIKSKGLNPLVMDGNQKKAYSRSSEFRIFKMQHVKEVSGMGERGDDWNEEKKLPKEETKQVSELSSDLLGQYKKAAGAQASAADKAGDYTKGNKRFSGIMKATRKQFDNDAKKINELKKQNDNMEIDSHITREDLRKWFSKTNPKGDWKRVNSKGEVVGPCAREPGEPKPKCMSKETRQKLSTKERVTAVLAKRRHDPDPERRGSPIHVSNYGKGKLSEETDAVDSLESSLRNPSSYDAIDQMMQTISNKSGITPKELHQSFVKKHGKTPDEYVKEVYEACWDTHKQVGTKMKGGKMVPDCVPKNEEAELEENMKKIKASDSGEYDYEGQMAKTQLQTISRNSKDLIDMLSDNENMPEWVQSKITLAQDYISSVRDYLQSKEELEEVANPAHHYHNQLTKDVAGPTSDVKEEVSKTAPTADAPKMVRDRKTGKMYDPNKKFKELMNKPETKAIMNRLAREEIEQMDEKNSPTNPALWSRAKSMARSKFDVYPSAYANGWASKWYKSKGGGWKSVKEDVGQHPGRLEDSPLSATNSVKAMESEHRKKNLKSARIIKSIYKKKGKNESMYDWEKTDKGGKLPTAKITLQGGTTMTGKPRDTVEIEPVLKTRPNSQKQ